MLRPAVDRERLVAAVAVNAHVVLAARRLALHELAGLDNGVVAVGALRQQNTLAQEGAPELDEATLRELAVLELPVGEHDGGALALLGGQRLRVRHRGHGRCWPGRGREFALPPHEAEGVLHVGGRRDWRRERQAALEGQPPLRIHAGESPGRFRDLVEGAELSLRNAHAAGGAAEELPHSFVVRIAWRAGRRRRSQSSARALG
mmetsp:Transcript_20633/g.62771  ORF Transcript_20633/g.62771 Transcript_20633/m.62771 type:complete len:204 (+) Transcript_20633:689-1300(+)